MELHEHVEAFLGELAHLVVLDGKVVEGGFGADAEADHAEVLCPEAQPGQNSRANVAPFNELLDLGADGVQVAEAAIFDDELGDVVVAHLAEEIQDEAKQVIAQLSRSNLQSVDLLHPYSLQHVDDGTESRSGFGDFEGTLTY